MGRLLIWRLPLSRWISISAVPRAYSSLALVVFISIWMGTVVISINGFIVWYALPSTSKWCHLGILTCLTHNSANPAGSVHIVDEGLAEQLVADLQRGVVAVLVPDEVGNGLSQVHLLQVQHLLVQVQPLVAQAAAVGLEEGGPGVQLHVLLGQVLLGEL